MRWKEGWPGDEGPVISKLWSGPAPDFSLPTVRCPGDYSRRSFAPRFLANYCAWSRAPSLRLRVLGRRRIVAMLDRGTRMEQGTLERFEILFPCARKSLTGWRVCFHANASRLMKFNAAPLSRNFIFERKCLVGRVNWSSLGRERKRICFLYILLQLSIGSFTINRERRIIAGYWEGCRVIWWGSCATVESSREYEENPRRGTI